MFDGKAFGAEIVDIVKGYMAKEVAPLHARIAELEARKPEPVKIEMLGPEGDAEIRRVAGEAAWSAAQKAIESVAPPPAIKAGRINEAGVLILALSDGVEIEAGDVRGAPGKDGDEVDVEALKAAILADVEKTVSALPKPKDGEDGKPGLDGKDADPVKVAALVAAEVEKAVSALPKPKDGEDGKPGANGEDVDTEAVASLVEVSVQKAVAAIPVPKDGEPGKPGADGIGLAGALIDRKGELVVTLTNGETKNLGPVVGKDGDPGRDGVGKDGADGLGFEDMDERLEDEGRTIVRTYRRGDVTKEFRFSLPVVLDRGVYKDAQTYQAGDGVTWAGSFWIAQKETSAKPEGGDGWRLAVKRGRDGKDGVPGIKGERGLPGERGKDLTQIGPDGAKW